MLITNMVCLKRQIKIKVVKASNTNGLKQEILKIIATECKRREFNRYETLNAINAINRTSFYAEDGLKLPVHRNKYQIARLILTHDIHKTYKLRITLNLQLIINLEGWSI